MLEFLIFSGAMVIASSAIATFCRLLASSASALPLLDQRAGDRIVEGPRRKRHRAVVGRPRLLAGGVLHYRVGRNFQPGIGMRFEPAVGAGAAVLRLAAVDAERQLWRLDERARAGRCGFGGAEGDRAFGHAVIVGDGVGELKGAALVHGERPARDGRRAILDDGQRIGCGLVGVADRDRRVAVERRLVAADRLIRFA